MYPRDVGTIDLMIGFPSRNADGLCDNASPVFGPEAAP
jgi:hypothetical protein